MSVSRARFSDDLTGLLFSRLRVVGLAGRTPSGRVCWTCVCTCGTEIVVPRNSLVTGNTKSCGCLKSPPLAEVFARHVDTENGPVLRQEIGPCHIWFGGRDADGYGMLSVSGRCRRATHVAFFLKHDRWPSPQALHRCDNPPCVRWGHLREGTHADNMRDRERRNREPLGEAFSSAKLTDEAVREIRASIEFPSVLASRFGVSETLVRRVLSRLAWRHVR